MTRMTPDAVQSDYVSIPKNIIQANKEITLFGNIFFINLQTPFLITLSDHLKFTTMKNIVSRKQTVMVPSLKDVKKALQQPRIRSQDHRYGRRVRANED